MTRAIKFLAVIAALILAACSNGNGNNAGSDGGGGEPVSMASGKISYSESPFQLCVGLLCTVEATTLPVPLPYSYAEGPAPAPFPGTAGVFPAMGWLVGTTVNRTIPVSFFQGNRLSGTDEGVVYEVTGVLSEETSEDSTVLQLTTNFPGASPATLTISPAPEGGYELFLQPPPEMAGAIALTMFSLQSPEDEGLFGLGARKDRFNQRGQIRNVWTEQQNTGASAFAEFAGQEDIPGISDLDPEDIAYQDERATFPNGAQAAYWVEAALFGSRGWAVWTQEPHFQRLDLASDDPGKIRWSVVGAEEVHIGIAQGTLEEASRAYTGYWGRAPAPPAFVYEPWLQTLNQGEGEAAPNGQGYWGGQRARCEVEEFIARSIQYELPFRIIGVEGWQSMPLGHPDCQTATLEEICAVVPTDEASYDADPVKFEACTNAAGEDYLDYLKQQGFDLAGYWNMFHTDPGCPGDIADDCTGSAGVPLESQQAFYRARDAGLYVQNAGVGGDHPVITNRQGISNIIDFTHPEVLPFWLQELTRMWDMGIYAFMHDFGELTTEEMSFANGEPIISNHNEYARAYHRIARLAADAYEAAHPGVEIYFYGRAGMTGACAATPGVFPGDESTSWDIGHGLASIIPAMLNLSLSGCYAFTTDIGGYLDLVTPRTTEELFIRWSQAAALTTIMRIHNSTTNGSVYPWTYAEEEGLTSQFDTIGIFRRYARLKSRLASEVVEPWATKAAADGSVGPVRPLVLVDGSAEAIAAEYQWLLGDDILVAPVIAQGIAEQAVYFPAGAKWARVRVGNNGEFIRTGVVYDGGTTHTVDVSIEDIPLFLRE